MVKHATGSLLVSGYTNPDLDAYACTAAYAELLNLQGKKARGACFGKPLGEVAYVLELLGEPQLKQLNSSDFDQFVIVDTSEALHIPSTIDPKKVVEVIDHHLYNDPADFPNARLDIQAVGAAATLVAERFQEANITPRRKIAALLYAAIISNTLNFKASVTTDRDAAAAGWLLDFADLHLDFARDLFAAKSDVAGEKLHELMSLEMNPLEVGGKTFVIGALELINVPELLEARGADIHQAIESIHRSTNSDVTLLSINDVDQGKTYFVTPFPQVQEILNSMLKVEFNGEIAEHPNIILRKEYVQDLRQKFFEKMQSKPRRRISLENWAAPGLVAALLYPITKLVFWVHSLLS